MGDVLALLLAGVACLALLVLHLIRLDRRTAPVVGIGTRGWLLIGAGALAVVSGTVLFWLRLFSR